MRVSGLDEEMALWPRIAIFVNVGTVINEVITRGPILEGIETGSENHVPRTVC